MSSQLALSHEMILKFLSEPSVYTQFGFLLPVKESAMKLGVQWNRRGCTACARRALKPTLNALAGAFTRLVVDESKRPNNLLPALRIRIREIIGGTFDEVLISYQDKANKPAQLVF